MITLIRLRESEVGAPPWDRETQERERSEDKERKSEKERESVCVCECCRELRRVSLSLRWRKPDGAFGAEGDVEIGRNPIAPRRAKKIVYDGRDGCWRTAD